MSGTTPGRSTIVTLDVPIWGMQEPPLQAEFQMEQISKQGKEEDHVVFVPGSGWELDAYEKDVSSAHELGDADTAVLTPSNNTLVNVAPGLTEIPTKRAYTEFTGIEQGNQRNGDLFLQKQATSTSDWSSDFSLTDDATAFPGPVQPTSLFR